MSVFTIGHKVKNAGGKQYPHTLQTVWGCKDSEFKDIKEILGHYQ